MGKIVREISNDGNLFIMAIDSTDMVNEAVRIHETSAVVTAAMGRLISAASMMGYLLKGDDDSVTLRLNGTGPLKSVIAVGDVNGNVKATVSDPIVEIPLNDKGKLDVGGALGHNGTLYVIKDMGFKEPYTGAVPFISGEIAEEITSYFAMSEQVPTVCALGVLVDTDLTVKCAGGYLIQLLPFAGEETISKVEKCIENIPSVTQMMSDGMTPDDICKKVLREFELEELDAREPKYQCNCSKEKVENALISLGREELAKMAEEDEVTEVGCQFCGKKYRFDNKDIKNLIKNSN